MINPINSALELVEQFKKRQLSPVEVTKATLAHISEIEPKINAFTYLDEKTALQNAEFAEEAYKKKTNLAPFTGVPFAIKNLNEVRDQPYDLSSESLKGQVGRVDTNAVKLMRNSGLNFFGRTNSPEFGLQPITESKLYGPCKNPFDLALNAGGSSGGAAAAVAAGIFQVAHASDGGGSIRIPASCCGLVGLKASRGRISKGPFISYAMHGIATDGCVSKTVKDSAAMLDVLASEDLEAWNTAPKLNKSYLSCLDKKPDTLKIAYSYHGPKEVPISQDAIDAVDKTVEILKSQGHKVVFAQPEWESKPLQQDGEWMIHAFLKLWITTTGYIDNLNIGKIEPITHNLHKAGKEFSSLDYVNNILKLQIFSRRVISFWRDYDIFITPTLTKTAPQNGTLLNQQTDDIYDFTKRAIDFCPATGWVNITGQPAISLPIHWCENNLPIGVQLVAGPFREDLLLQLSAELERESPWIHNYNNTVV